MTRNDDRETLPSPSGADPGGRAVESPAWALSYLPVAAVAFAGMLLGSVFEVVGPAAAALVIGTVVAAIRPLPAAAAARTKRAGPVVLQWSIVALGGSVGIVEVLSVARDSLPVMLITVFVGMGLILSIGKRIGVGRNIRSLLAVGTSICGASAIAAAAPVLGAETTEITLAVSIVFMFNFVAVLGFPPIAHWLGLSSHQFALWAGTAINDTSSVLAAAVSYGPAVVAQAATVKLARTMMILPVTLVLSYIIRRAGESKAPLGTSLRRAVPWFAVAFVVASIANSAGLAPAPIAAALGHAASLGSVVALAAIGLSTDLGLLRTVGIRPVALAGAGWLLIAAISLLVQAASGQA